MGIREASDVLDARDDNYADAIARFAVGYNKGIILNSVTQHSLDILDDSMKKIESSLSSIVTAFEEIRATSGSTSTNTERIESMMADILAGNDGMSSGIAARMADVERGVKAARDIGSMFGGLKEKTKSVAGITGAIQDVSDRTNILAINVSIEAARAGEAGAGFAVGGRTVAQSFVAVHLRRFHAPILAFKMRHASAACCGTTPLPVSRSRAARVRSSPPGSSLATPRTVYSTAGARPGRSRRTAAHPSAS